MPSGGLDASACAARLTAQQSKRWHPKPHPRRKDPRPPPGPRPLFAEEVRVVFPDDLGRPPLVAKVQPLPGPRAVHVQEPLLLFLVAAPKFRTVDDDRIELEAFAFPARRSMAVSLDARPAKTQALTRTPPWHNPKLQSMETDPANPTPPARLRAQNPFAPHDKRSRRIAAWRESFLWRRKIGFR